jgi:ferrous iron transport protein B
MVKEMWENPEIRTEQTVTDLAEKMNIPEEDVTPMDASLLANVGNAVSVVFRPLGFGSWKPTVATVTGLVAKEEVVGTFGVLYNYDDSEEELGENGEQIWSRVALDYTAASALVFMVFNLLCAPCFAAIGAIKREMHNAKWTWAAIGYMTVWAYALALICYQIGGLITGELAFGIGTVVGIALIVLLVYLLVRRGYIPKEGKRSLTSVDAAMM